MKNLTILLYTVLLLLMPCASSAAVTCYEKRYLNTQDQLPVSAIHSVFRDTEGYLWYGTVNGLCRDDGYQLQVFRPGFLQAQDRVIACMAEDPSGHIWLGSDNGLSWLDKADYTIHALCPERWEGERISRILPADIGPDFLIQSRSRIIWVDSVGRPIREFCWKDKDGNERGIAWSVPFHKKTYIAFNDYSFCYVDSGQSELHPIALPKPFDKIVCFDIDRQKVTVFGSPADVEALIREEVTKLSSPAGGLMMIYGWYAGTPLENVRALMDALEKYMFYWD